jgi:sugar lactone lactonase YvrE/dienelactone hydrolase
LLAGLLAVVSGSASPIQPPAQVAQEILAQTGESQREGLIEKHKSMARDLILEWTKDLRTSPADPSSASLEYQRVPTIWRVAILAVRDPASRNTALVDLVDLSLPAPTGPMHDWQTVVLGGAIINGLSLEGLWPKVELENLLAKHPEWKPRWDRALELAKSDAFNPKIPAGTRYDAIRILAMLPAEQAVGKIRPFLDLQGPVWTGLDAAAKDELQMGAISALSDIDAPEMFDPMLSTYSKFSYGNQKLATQAMQRTDQRKLAWQILDSDLKEQLYHPKAMTLDHAFTEGIEGPTSDAQGNVYAVNFGKQQTIGKVDRWGNGTTWATLPNRGTGNGIVIDSQGDLLVADYVEHKIWRVDRVTGAFVLHCHEPAMHQPNDLAIADDGTLYASDPNWNDATGRIWRIDRQGIAQIVADRMGTTNGIDISPDGKYLSVNESQQRKIWRFEIQKDGTLGAKSLFKEFPDHGFDGMRYDDQGNLYVTRYGEGTVLVLSPEGQILRRIDVLGARPSNICFGGPDGKTVFVTEVEHGRLIRFRVEHAGRSPRFRPEDRRADWIDKIHSWPDQVLADQADQSQAQADSRGLASLQTLADWQQARAQVQARFERLLGPMPQVGRAPKLQVLKEDRVEGVLRRRVKIELENDVWMDAYVLLPDGLESSDSRPGMVALHPTNNATIDEIAGVGTQGPRATALEFAKLGYIVICPECFLWQEGVSFDQAVANHSKRHPQARGIAKMVYDARRALDVLLDIPQVDPKRVFAFGHSLGAKEVLYLMASDARVLAGVASEGGVDLQSTNWDAPWYLNPAPRLAQRTRLAERIGPSTQQNVSNQQNVSPERRADWGHDELLMLIAPRPLLIMGGQRGPGAADGSQSLPEMRRAFGVWRLYGSGSYRKNPMIPGDSLSLALWNHGQGHVFGDWQFEQARVWFEAYQKAR